MPTPAKELLSGWLQKKSRHGLWSRRFFLLDSGALTYYHGSAAKGPFSLRDWCNVVAAPSGGEFEVIFSGTAPEVFPEKRLRLRAEKADARETVAREFEEPPPRPRVRLLLSPRGASDGAGASDGCGAVDVCLSVRHEDCSAAVCSWFAAVSATLESLHVPLECEKEETWGSRLSIAKKGGGEHFSEEERKLADEAYGRIGTIYEYVTASSQLAERAELLPRLAATLSSQKELSKALQLKKMHEAMKVATSILTRLSGAEAGLRRRFGDAGLPDTLPISLHLTWGGLPALLCDVLALADEEYGGWASESSAKRRFRTPRSHAILHAALSLADEMLGHAPARARVDETAGGVEGVEALRRREEELKVAAEAANAVLAAEDYDEAV